MSVVVCWPVWQLVLEYVWVCEWVGCVLTPERGVRAAEMLRMLSRA